MYGFLNNSQGHRLEVEDVEEPEEDEVLEDDELLDKVLKVVEEEEDVEEVLVRKRLEEDFGGPGFVSTSPASIISAAVHLWESRGQHGQKTGSEGSPPEN